MICIILPAYDEEQSVDTLLGRIEQIMRENQYEYKIVFVNDGSKDRTAGMLEPYLKRMPIEVIAHKINRGLWETIRDGFERAAEICRPGDIIIRMDCDNTHDPKYIPSMISKINEGFGVVIASRFQKSGKTYGVSAYRMLISRLANLIMKIFFPIRGVREYSCGYRAYKAGLVQNALKIFENSFIDLKGLGFTCTVEKLIKFRMMKARITEIPFKLKYNLKKSSSKMVSSITTVGYLILIMKYIYPWGKTGKEWKRKIKRLNKEE